MDDCIYFIEGGATYHLCRQWTSAVLIDLHVTTAHSGLLMIQMNPPKHKVLIINHRIWIVGHLISGQFLKIFYFCLFLALSRDRAKGQGSTCPICSTT